MRPPSYCWQDESDEGDPYIRIIYPVGEGVQLLPGVFEPTQDFGITEQL